MIYDPRSIQLSPQQQEEIAALSERTGRPWQEVLEEAFAKFIRPIRSVSRTPEESVFDSLQKAGLIGCIKGGPADLSTNPAHMDGFGESS